MSPEELCQFGLALCDDENLVFVHGAAVQSPEHLLRIEYDRSHRKKKDFGSGFYTFDVCRGDGLRGILTAIRRAVREAARPAIVSANTPVAKRDPFLVFIQIKREDYENLNKLDLNEGRYSDLDDDWRLKAVSQYDVIYGPLLMNGFTTVIPNTPIQYKFEESCDQFWYKLDIKRVGES